MTELKACPCHFCGSTATSAAFFRASDDYQGWQVECSSCGGSGPMNMNTEADAITAWNTRHPTPAADEVEAAYKLWVNGLRGYAERVDAFKAGWIAALKGLQPRSSDEVEALRKAAQNVLDRGYVSEHIDEEKEDHFALKSAIAALQTKANG